MYPPAATTTPACFAYNFIRRGERYGLRIIGSLKSKPALNVLAAYEK